MGQDATGGRGLPLGLCRLFLEGGADPSGELRTRGSGPGDGWARNRWDLLEGLGSGSWALRLVETSVPGRGEHARVPAGSKRRWVCGNANRNRTNSWYTRSVGSTVTRVVSSARSPTGIGVRRHGLEVSSQIGPGVRGRATGMENDSFPIRSRVAGATSLPTHPRARGAHPGWAPTPCMACSHRRVEVR